MPIISEGFNQPDQSFAANAAFTTSSGLTAVATTSNSTYQKNAMGVWSGYFYIQCDSKARIDLAGGAVSIEFLYGTVTGEALTFTALDATGVKLVATTLPVAALTGKAKGEEMKGASLYSFACPPGKRISYLEIEVKPGTSPFFKSYARFDDFQWST